MCGFMPLLGWLNAASMMANPHLQASPPREVLSVAKATRKRAVPQEVHSNYIRHISLRSRSRRLLRAELGNREATVAPRGGAATESQGTAALAN